MVWIIPYQNIFPLWSLVFFTTLLLYYSPELFSHVIPCFLLAHIDQLLQFFTHIDYVEKCLLPRLGSAELWCGNGPEVAGREPVPSAGEATLHIWGGCAPLRRSKGLLLMARQVLNIWEFQIFMALHPNICIPKLRALPISNHSTDFSIENHLPPANPNV